MGEDKARKIIMECTLSYVMTDGGGGVIAGGSANAQLDDSHLSILPEGGDPWLFSYSDIIGISEGDYRISIFLSSGSVTLTELGYKYEDFLINLYRLRGELLVRYMLMDEKLRESGVEASFVYFDHLGGEAQKGTCELRLYDTAMIVLPQKGEPLRVPYSYVSAFKGEDYSFELRTELEERFLLSQMGEKFDFFVKGFSGMMNEISGRVQSLVREILPQLDPIKARKLAYMIREGRASKKEELDPVSEEFWPQMEKRVKMTDLSEGYEFLKGLSHADKICIGIKRGLMGDLTGDYIWLLMPIYDADPVKPGNAVALEAVSGEDQGRATYFFRLTSRREYPQFGDIMRLHGEYDLFVKTINRCMVDINFRREQIYLSNERLADPKYAMYMYAVRRLHSLSTLRNLFIGRVIHSSPEKWRDDVMDLLKFNVGTDDDSRKWSRGAE